MLGTPRREGLTDADRGDGIEMYIKLREKSGITSADVIRDESDIDV
jgi:hypothetical protein